MSIDLTKPVNSVQVLDVNKPVNRKFHVPEGLKLQ